MTEVEGTESLERLVIEVEAQVSKAVAAELATIKVQLNRIAEFVTLCETLAAQLQESPMFQMMAGGGGLPGFPGFGA
jgi:hypothetical protein